MKSYLGVQEYLGVIVSIEMIEDFPWEDRGCGYSHNITHYILSEEQVNKKTCAYYIIGSKYKQSSYHIKNDYDTIEHLKMYNMIEST